MDTVRENRNYGYRSGKTENMDTGQRKHGYRSGKTENMDTG